MDQITGNCNSAKMTRREMLKLTGMGVLATGLVGGGVLGYLNRRSISAVNNLLKIGTLRPFGNEDVAGCEQWFR